MQNEFEKKLKQEMETFSLIPSDDVWHNVSLRIKKDKQKKRAFILWFFAGLLFLAGGFLAYKMDEANTKDSIVINNSHKDKQQYKGRKTENISSNNDNTPKDLQTHKPASDKGLVITHDAFAGTNVKKESGSLAPENFQAFIKPGNEKSSNDQRPIAKEYSASQPALSKNTPLGDDGETFQLEDDVRGNQLEKSLRKEIDNIDNKEEASNELQPLVLEENELITVADTLNKSILNSYPTAKINKQEKTLKKWRIGFTIYSGISNNQNSIFTLPQARAVNQNLASPFPGTTFSSGSKRLEYNWDLSVGAGIYFQKKLTGRLAFSTGIDYHYLSVGTSTGSVINNTVSVSNPLSGGTQTLSSYYVAGSSNSYLNKYHFVQLPVDLLWQLNKNRAKPIEVSVGLTPALLVGNNGLFVNNNYGIAYKESEQYKRFSMFSQIGVLFPLNQQFQLGPSLKYGLTDMSKPALNNNQHLIFLGIKAKYFLNNSIK